MPVEYTRYEPKADGTDENEPLVVSLFSAVTAQQGEQEASSVQLYDHIDIEAVEQLLAHAGSREESDWELTFAVEDVEVTVTSDGAVTVR